MLTLLVKFFSLSDQFLLNEFKQNFGRDRATGNQIGKGSRKDSRPDLIQCPFHQTSLTAEIKAGIIALQGRDLFFEFCRDDSLIQQRFCLGCNAISNVIYPYNGGVRLVCDCHGCPPSAKTNRHNPFHPFGFMGVYRIAFAVLCA